MKKWSRKVKIFSFIFLIAIFVFLVSACTPQQTKLARTIAKASSTEQGGITNPPVQQTNETIKTINMIIYHTGYDPSLITANKGDKVRIFAVTASGTSSHNHGITIDAYGINRAVTSENSNSPVLIEFVAEKTGKFTIYCNSCKEGIYGNAHPDIRATLEVK